MSPETEEILKDNLKDTLKDTEEMKIESISEPTSAAEDTQGKEPEQIVCPKCEINISTLTDGKSQCGCNNGEPYIPITRLHLCSDGKHRNDEQYEVYKKYEESLVLKKAQFNKDPDQFVHIDDLVMAVVNGDNGHNSFMGRYNLQELKAALVTLQVRLFTEITEFEYMMKMKAAAKKEGLVGADGKKITSKPSGIIT